MVDTHTATWVDASSSSKPLGVAPPRSVEGLGGGEWGLGFSILSMMSIPISSNGVLLANRA